MSARAAALAVAIGAAALVFDIPSLGVAAIVLAVLIAGAELWVVVAARGTRVKRTLGAAHVIEGAPLAVVFDVRVRGGPLPGGWLEDPLLPDGAPLHGGHRRLRLEVEARFDRRGVRRLPPPRVLIGDPLGVAQRRVTGNRGAGDEVLVLPRVESVAWRGRAGAGAHGIHALSAPAEETELDGVRELREGTPASRIYWPAAARGAGLMERRMLPGDDALPLVVLDPHAPASEGDLDAAVRAAASLCLHLARAGGCRVLLPGDRRATAVGPDLRAWPEIHARLARVGPGSRPALGRLTGRRGIILLVQARRGGQPLSALRPGGAGPRVVVVPGELPGRTATFTVAGCTGHLVGVRGAARRPQRTEGA